MKLAHQPSQDEDHSFPAEAKGEASGQALVAERRASRAEQAGRAAVTVAEHSTDAVECKELLDMLGLELDSVRQRSI